MDFGLLRTDFYHGKRDPTLDEQNKHYRAIVNLLDDIQLEL